MTSLISDDDLTGAATDRPSFIAAEPGTYTLELTVSDGKDSDTDEVDVEVFETVEPPDPPDPVLDLLARAKSGKVDLVWTPVDRAVAYRVLRTDDPTLESEFELLHPMYESDYAVYVDLTVTNGVTYFYAVIPIDAAGQEGPPSNVAEATPEERAR